MAGEKNPIIRYIGGIAIRKKNQLSICVDEQEMVRLIEVSIETGLSIPKIIAMQGQPCQNCGNDNIVIPRGLLRTDRKQTGSSITKTAKDKNKNNEQTT